MKLMQSGSHCLAFMAKINEDNFLSSYSVIVRVSVVLKRTVVGD